MHEFGVTQAALEAALARAEESGASRITDVHLAIGTVSSIDPRSIRLYWSELSEDTLAKGAALHFRSVPTESMCADCGYQFVVETSIPPCPTCGSLLVHALDDEFMALEAIDVERPPVENTLE